MEDDKSTEYGRKSWSKPLVFGIGVAAGTYVTGWVIAALGEKAHAYPAVSWAQSMRRTATDQQLLAGAVGGGVAGGTIAAMLDHHPQREPSSDTGVTRGK